MAPSYMYVCMYVSIHVCNMCSRPIPTHTHTHIHRCVKGKMLLHKDETLTCHLIEYFLSLSNIYSQWAVIFLVLLLRKSMFSDLLCTLVDTYVGLLMLRN